MSQYKILVTGISDETNEDTLKNLFDKLTIPFTNQIRIVQPRHVIGQKRKDSRFTVLSFETEEQARTAIDVIRQIQYTPKTSGHIGSLNACEFVDGFRIKFSEGTGIVVFNLPKEIKHSDVYDLFQQFGEVLSIFLEKDEKRKQKDQKSEEGKDGLMAKIIYKSKDEARMALENVDGKYLGKNQVHVKEYHDLQWRLANNADILIRDCPINTTREDIIKAIESLGFSRDDFLDDDTEIFIGEPYEKFDDRVKQCIFTCKSKEVRDQILKKAEEESCTIDTNKLTFLEKLTKGMIALRKAEQVDDPQKYTNLRNISIYNVARNENVNAQDVREFFEQYGEIEEFGEPKIINGQYDQEKAHFNILYKSEDAARLAIERAADDESKLQNRLSERQLVVQQYQKKNVAHSTDGQSNQQREK